MLLPALNKARDKAKAIGCVNNLKQIGTAQAMYSTDYGDYIVPAICQNGGTNTIQRTWIGSLTGYGNAKTSGYGVKFSGKTEGSFVCPGEPIGFGASSSGKFAYTHYGINARLAGKYSEAAYNYHKLSSVYSPTIAIFATDNNIKFLYSIDYGNYASFRHGATTPGGRANVVYVDGHVEPKNFVDLNTPWNTTALLTGYR